MFEVFLLAFALSMDAFAVSLCLGAKDSLHTRKTAIIAALYFGIFQAIMPLIGFFIGKQIVGWFEEYDHWIAFIILFIIGLKMIRDSFKSESCEIAPQKISHKALFFLAVATSIDALAAGLTLNFMDLSVYISVVIIGVVTFIMGFFGVLVGKKSGALLEKKAEFIGGFILILIGCKILYEHHLF
ncbi:MAG: manganese efflux pump MntP family protein [Campylobacteraceae bacterium]|nr:manganese efflux pump MntP family protein [Campylobacteraceae bacterium]